jgi:hypothetical protein
MFALAQVRESRHGHMVSRCRDGLLSVRSSKKLGSAFTLRFYLSVSSQIDSSGVDPTVLDSG